METETLQLSDGAAGTENLPSHVADVRRELANCLLDCHVG